MSHGCPFLRSRSRYGVRPVKSLVAGGRTFDSGGERRRFGVLQMAEMGGVIADLRYHPVYAFTLETPEGEVATCPQTWEADFDYRVVRSLGEFSRYPAGTLVVEDYKDGVIEPVTRLKWWLMLVCHGVRVRVSGPADTDRARGRSSKAPRPGPPARARPPGGGRAVP